MKKVLAVLAVVLMLSVSAFANVTTFTKEMAQGGYPGVLNPGSMTGANVFITDMSLMTNTALFEYIFGTPVGLIALKNDTGTIGLSISPLPNVSLTGINVATPNDVLGLEYITPMAGMDVGIGILYGNDITGWKNKEVVTNGQDPDETSAFTQYIGIKLGSSMKGNMAMDLGLSVGLSNHGDMTKDLYNTVAANQRYKNTNDNSKISADLSARVALDKSIKAVVSIDFVTGQDKYTRVADLDNNLVNEIDFDNIYTNMGIGASALIGKDIKATDTLTVKMATGIRFATNSQELYLQDHSREVGGIKTYNGTSYSEITFRIPLNFGIEGKLNDTWVVNAGTNAQLAYIHSRGDKTNPDTTASKFNDIESTGDFTLDPNLGFAIGLTGKIGDLTIDMYTRPNILINGPYFLTGSGSGSLNYGVALSYNWK